MNAHSLSKRVLGHKRLCRWLFQDRSARHAYLFWICNIFEQNRYLPVFPEILRSICPAVAHFLWNQWKLDVSSKHPLVICTRAHVLAHLLRTATRRDSFFHLIANGVDIRQPGAFGEPLDECKKLKIRGMLHREGKAKDDAHRQATLRFSNNE